MCRTKQCWWWLLSAIALCVAGQVVSAQPQVSQPTVAANPILDEFGEVLNGTSPGAQPAVVGDVVQVLHATDNTIYPPEKDGTPDPRNVVLATLRVGYGTSPNLSATGKFGVMLTPRPGGNSRIFVRVFNAADLPEASFYGDSQTFTVRSWKNDVFYADIAQTDQPLDPDDDDGDGLNNSWEKSYGTDPNLVDSDGDGLTDGEEVAIKTDALDGESNLKIVRVTPVGAGDAWLTWDSVEGVTYRIEYTPDELTGNPVFSLVDTVTAGAGNTSSLLVPGGLADEQGSYRVRVVP